MVISRALRYHRSELDMLLMKALANDGRMQIDALMLYNDEIDAS
jgi:hypothetical protein